MQGATRLNKSLVYRGVTCKHEKFRVEQQSTHVKLVQHDDKEP